VAVAAARFETLQTMVFFNRIKEITELTTFLKSKPKLTVLLGPPSSGKTAFMKHVVSQTVNNNPLFHPIRIDLRTVDVSSNDSLYSALAKKVKQIPEWKWTNKVVSSVESSYDGVSVKANLNPDSIATLPQLLDAIKSEMKPFDWWHGQRQVVLVVDEANELKHLKNKGDLDTFLKFAVEVTKQESQSHVVLTSSDSFFESWLVTAVPRTHFHTLVLGDLTVEQAHKYYLEQLELSFKRHAGFPLHLFDKDLDSFKDVFHVTGGRMFFIDSYIEQVHARMARIAVPQDFDAVSSEAAGLDKMMRDSKEYTRKDFKMVLGQLTASPNGYLDYGRLNDKLRNAKTSALIRDNVLHYRPPSQFARDLSPVPEDAVVTASSQPALRAMEHLLKRL
jgi:ATPase domain predominantly from Archaea